MSTSRGMLALMGSGELTSTMVEVHKELVGRFGKTARAVFLDTPAGFQLNADDLAQRAVSYFQNRVQHPMSIVSFKSRQGTAPYDAEKAYRALREADIILIGPGSPTYAVSQWLGTPIPEILMQRIQDGACLVAASAAALTVGRLTLPVYEIYKVGSGIHWVEGIHLLDHFGFPLVVVPHWNNAEGGTHDTRFCYMGEPRFKKLEVLLPQDVFVLGLDEHTACMVDLEAGEARVRGIGKVTLRYGGSEIQFPRGESFSLDLLRSVPRERRWRERDPEAAAVSMKGAVKEEDSFWREVQNAEAAFEQGVRRGAPGDLVNALLELDRVVWKGQQDMEDPEFIVQARERFRELVVRLGGVLEDPRLGGKQELELLVEALLRLRESYRSEKRWRDADLLRDCLRQSGVTVEDTPHGSRWKLESVNA